MTRKNSEQSPAPALLIKLAKWVAIIATILGALIATPGKDQSAPADPAAVPQKLVANDAG